MNQLEDTYLKSGVVGDLHREVERLKLAARTGLSLNGPRTGGIKKLPEYRSWKSMKDRCLRKSHKAYEQYGGRGITICDRWMIFSNFLEDMGRRPSGFTLDRIDNNNGYSKDNCRWVDHVTQQRNKRSCFNVTIKGIEFRSISEAAEYFGIKRKTLEKRIRQYGTNPEFWHLKHVPINGEHSRNSKLTRDDAEHIRALYRSRTQKRGWRKTIAGKYGICAAMVTLIVHNRKWL